jgi:methylenetetrahydrofolate dehydrogenase (NADP+) / methenyltetrahydrofolate cyclohydrolase
MGIRMDGKALADKICLNLKERCNKLIELGIQPALTIVTTGDDSASKVYVRNKVKRCEEIGIKPDVRHYDYLTKQDFLDLNREVDNPIIVQEPITGEVDHDFVAEYLNPVQDVDGFADYNVARLATGGKPYNYPCTPNGVMALLHEYGVEIEGKNALVIGRSNIVGRPMAMMFEHEGATVTIAHSKTKNLLGHIFNADIVVSATGHRMTNIEQNVADVKKILGVSNPMADKIIIDVGMNRDENGKLCGDFSEDFKAKFGFYTPTPGSTGPMTVAMLMENTIKFYEREFYDVL